ncbi:MAG: hypothetical protein AAF993_13695 [Pseudomonadota bacterium]
MPQDIQTGRGPARASRGCSRVRLLLCLSCAVLWLFSGSQAWAIGTDAGTNIENTATVSFAIAGAAQTPVSSNTTQTLVDELLDAVVVSNNGGAVAVATPATGAILQFTITNTGNGEETYRLLADPDVAEGGFNPVLNQIYLETNGVPGLQIGSDTAYVSGAGDPLLVEDESLIVYVQADIPGALAQNSLGEIQLRAVSETLINQSGTDDPTNAAWPTPGTSYANLGTGSSDAVIGASHDITNLLVRDGGQFQVSAAVLSVSKTAVQVVDPFGGSTVVPGSVITYQLELNVVGTGTADDVVLTDVIPVELSYLVNTLTVDGIAEDDDFAPAGTDNSGFDTGASTVRITRAAVVGGGPPLVVRFDATVQ